MDVVALKELIRQELPGLLQDDPSLRAYILELTRREYPTRLETEDRFYQLLGELRRDREEQSRKWDEWNRKWDADKEEQNRKWEEQNRKWDEWIHKSNEQSRQWLEQWEAHQRQHKEEFDQAHEEVMALAKKHDRAVGALGSRWGIQSEKAFRDALAGILEKNFAVQVINVNEFDDQGEVFGRPDQVELDVMIKNGLLLICELKSSIDKAGMYIFERKARFYEKRHQRKANRLIVISPMVDTRARNVAEQLGIEIYGDSEDVEKL